MKWLALIKDRRRKRAETEFTLKERAMIYK